MVNKYIIVNKSEWTLCKPRGGKVRIRQFKSN
jgi:hypothetical protein